MWYFAWVLGLGLAVLLSILNAMWLENEQNRSDAFTKKNNHHSTPSDENELLS